MTEQFVGEMIASSNDRFGIVVSRFNDAVTQRLLSGATDTLIRHGVATDQISVFWTPGAFELPIVVEKLSQSSGFSAIIALGAVIQGDTGHHEYINHAVAQGLMSASQRSNLPVLFGVLTCHTMEQALDRSGGKSGNKGSEAALAALETVNLLKKIT